MNDFVRMWEDVRSDVLEAVDAVGKSGWYILGAEVREFEAALAQWWGRPHAVGVGSGLDAIEIGLRCLGCKAGDKVLTTPLSAFATTLAIVKLGAVPVFVDTDDFGLIDLDACEEALRGDPGIRFLLPVHLYGHALDVSRLRRLAGQFEVRILEDCAQSIGARHNGISTGAAGSLAATSFYPTKNLGCIGDGGALLMDESSSLEPARALRDYGQTGKYRHDLLGYNSRLDELQAAILRRAFLPRLDAWTSRRKEIAGRYMSGIGNPDITLPGSPPGSESCWHLFPVLVDPARKNDFMSHLRREGVACGEHYPIPIPDQGALAGARFEVAAAYENAKRICRSQVSLPIQPYLTDEQTVLVIAACNSWR